MGIKYLYVFLLILHVTNITFSIDDDLYKNMKKHPEIKWSEIFRKAVRDYLATIDHPLTILGEQLFKSIPIAASSLSLEQDLELRKSQRDLERKRVKAILTLESQNMED